MHGEHHDDTEPAAAGPVVPGERLLALDALRGVGVLGILVMNIYAFAMPFAAYTNPFAWGGTEFHNLATWFATHILFDQKFMSIFSMLFGAGIVLMSERADARGASFAGIYYRRMFWLMVIGLVHAYLIWFGDILFFYAVTGMVVFLFRRRTPRTLIVIACLMLPVAVLFGYAGGTYMEDLKARAETYAAEAQAGETLDDEAQAVIDEWDAARAFLLPGPEEIQKDLDAYRGEYAGIVTHRAPFLISFQFEGLPFFILWRVGGLMLIGMALMKLGVLTAERSTRFYRRFMLVSYALGLPLTIFSALDLHAHEFDQLYVMRAGGLANYFGSVIVALGHVGLVMWLTKTGGLRRLMDRFAAVGRMALTNYLAHSVILTAVFYGYGFGLYASVPRFWQMGFVVAVIGLQLLWSPWWLARFRFGPAEWLWRSLTYGKRQPMR